MHPSYFVVLFGVVFGLLGCSSTHSNAPKKSAECSRAHERAFLETLSDTKPEQRLSAMDAFVETCGDIYPVYVLFAQKLRAPTTIKLSQPKTEQPAVSKHAVHISQEWLYLDAKRLMKREELESNPDALRTAFAALENNVVLEISVDAEVPYKNLVSVIDLAKTQKIDNIVLTGN